MEGGYSVSVLMFSPITSATHSNCGLVRWLIGDDATFVCLPKQKLFKIDNISMKINLIL